MASEPYDPPRDSTDEPSEVLSETTDLDALMAAILGDGIPARSPVGAAAMVPADLQTAGAELPEPTPVASPPPAEYLHERVITVAIPDRQVDAWGFETEGPQNGREIAFETAVVRQPGRDVDVAVTPRRSWRDVLRGSSSKQWAIVAGLLAAPLMTVSAISLRGEPAQTPRRSSGSPGLMRARPPVQPSGAVQPRVATEAEVRSPAMKSGEVPAIGAPPATKRANPATDERTTSITVETRDVIAPLTWPIVMSPDTMEEVVEASDRPTAPAQPLRGGAQKPPR